MGKGLVLHDVLDVPWHNLEMMNKGYQNQIPFCFVVWLMDVPTGHTILKPCERQDPTLSTGRLAGYSTAILATECEAIVPTRHP